MLQAAKTDDGSVSCSMCNWEVSGGRLGRDHKLADVPVNYFRDRLMDWITERLEDGLKQRAIRKAICPDLIDAEIEEYVRLIAEDRKNNDEEENRGSRWFSREERVKRILDFGKLARTHDEAMEIVEMYDAVHEIDSDTDWKMPKPMGIYRDFEKGPKPVEGSVIRPNRGLIERYERGWAANTEIDRDCDQVRAMIKVFCRWIKWNAEYFRMALGSHFGPWQL